MCGIAGIISKNGQFDLARWGQVMAAALSHRGPDDSQHQVIDNIALVHTRLAIQDLSENGRQPMTSESGRYVIVFNGEIYNFISLRDELEKLGHKFNGGSDTEVILAAFEEYGIESGVKKFEGMFAFALIDKAEKCLHLCRDRLGEKPLYYTWLDDVFAWGSELKAIKALENWQGKVNTSVVSKYLQYGYVPTPWTMYENCYKLEPGTILSLPLEQIWDTSVFSPNSNSTSAKFLPVKYWDLDEVIESGQREIINDYSTAVDKLDQILAQVVTDQMVSDVPIGAFLSGGIDSSLVASVMQSLSDKPINTFTIGFKEKDYNEAEFASQIAKHIGSNHHELYISSKDCLDKVTELPQMFDEPFADSSALPAYFVSAMAKQKVTVCLSGDGGDELFCGYNRYVKTQQIWKKIGSLPLPVRNTFANIMLLFKPSHYEKVYQLLMTILRKDNPNSRVGLKVQKLAQLLKNKNVDQIYEMLVSYCQADSDVFLTPKNDKMLFGTERFSGLNHHSEFIEKAMAIDTVTYLPDDNLTKVDRTSMASSLETRLPLLNHKVVEFAWQLPLSAKYQPGQTKRILRDVLYKRVPRELIERPKMGFSVPIADWLKGPLKSWADELLLSSSSYSHQLLDSSKVEGLWTEHSKGIKDNSAALWSLLMFQSWYHH